MAPHTRKTVGKILIVFGGNPEPIFAGTASFLDFIITDGKKPIEGLEPIVDLSSSDKKLQLFPTQGWGENWGTPGCYHVRVFFTDKGTYGARLEFSHKGEKIVTDWSFEVFKPNYFPHEPK